MARAQTDKPNLVIIFTDDQGYADLSCFGGKHVHTPHIDRMAEEGARLTSFYVAAPLCTPSRAALMTGCYPKRIGMAVGSSLVIENPILPPGAKFPVGLAGDGKGLNPDGVTTAEIALSAGYRTGMFGKWHLGDQPEFLPTRQGFETFAGLPYSHDITPKHPRQKYFKFPPLPFLEGERVTELDPDPDFLTRRTTERAVEFIKTHKDENFLLYVAHSLPHAPWAASPQIKKKYAQELEQGVQADPEISSTAIYEIDWSVGEILAVLKEQGIDENTTVLFTSDNGPAGRRKNSAKPLRSRKGQTFEGGMRMPTVIRGPKRIPAGSNSDEILTTMDILPTFANLIGVELPDGLVIDGKDILPVLTGEAGSPHDYFFYYNRETLEAVRWQEWKLRIVNGQETLYKLSDDIAEQINLASEQPDIVLQLKTAMQDFEAELAKSARPAGHVESPEILTLN